MTPTSTRDPQPASRAAGHLLTEGLIDLTEAARDFADAKGRKPHIATLRRWAKSGCRGHRLETTFLGNRLMTSHQATARFLAAINGRPATPAAAVSSAAERAGHQLDELLG
jgi:hypothetical protein